MRNMNDYDTQRRRNKAAAILYMQCNIKILSDILSATIHRDLTSPFGGIEYISIQLRTGECVRLDGVWDLQEANDIISLIPKITR